MSDIVLVKYDASKKVHTPVQKGDTIPADVAPIRAGDSDYYPDEHISPPLIPGNRVWLNDPQPFLYDAENQRYVLWYLYNEDSDTENGTAWREVLTKDFVTFEDHGIRIPKYTTPYGDIWSGSPFLDTDNIFGYGAGAILFYVTMPCDKAGPGSQSVALWVSRKGFGHDPEFVDIVIPNPDGTSFRDPKVFLGDDKRTLYMIIAVTAGVATFSSMDGKSWTRISTLPLDNLGTIECPDLISIDGQQILIFSANGFEHAPVTTQTMFVLVDFNLGKIKITQPMPSDIKRMCIDTGPDFYAARCGQTTVGDNIMLGWANNWNYAYNLPTPDYSGTLALPRILDLYTYSDGYKGVVGAPVARQTTAYAQTTTQTGVALSGDYSPIPFLDVPESSRIDFTIHPDPTNGWPKNFGIFIGSGDVKSFSTAISVNGDGTGTGGGYFENTRNDFGGRPTGSIKEWNEYYRRYFDTVPSELDVTIVVDRCTAEVFVNGIYAQTFLVMWPIGAQVCRLSIPAGYTLSADVTLRFNRRPGRVNGAFTRAHADSIYMFNDTPVITTYEGDANNPNTKHVRQIATDVNRGPFFQVDYGGPYYNFWQIDPKYLDLVVYGLKNDYVDPVRQIFVDKDATKGVGVKIGYGTDTIYLATKGDKNALQQQINASTTAIQGLDSTVTIQGNRNVLTNNQTQVNAESIANVDAHYADVITGVETQITGLGTQTANLSSQLNVVQGMAQGNSTAITAIKAQLAGTTAGAGTTASIGSSPNTVGNPALMDRYPLKPADVAKMVQQGAEQKAQGLAYAGKYALTPQMFPVNADGMVKLTPYGSPPTNGVTTTGLGSTGVPIITDACHQYYDQASGIHYRWDQFQHSSQSYPHVHWTLDGPVLSVSLDGLKWVTVRTLLYGQTGPNVWTGFWVDRDNRLGQGHGAFLVTSTNTSVALPNLTAAAGVTVAGSPNSQGDHRVYWDPDVFKGFSVLGVNGSNTGLLVNSGADLNHLSQAFTIGHSIFGQGRVECPSWLPMYDTVTGTKLQVLSVAIQRGGTGLYESCVLGAGTYNTGGLTLTSDFRYVEWGADAYAQILVDPMQQDGTGGTSNGCKQAVYNVASMHWDYINNESALPSFGFGGGQHLPADAFLINGTPMLLPSAKFKAACSGNTYTGTGIGQGTTAVNPGWTLGVTSRSEVWRAELDAELFTFTGTTTVRFHFGTRWVDYIFGNGIINFNNANSGTTTLHVGSRAMPLTRSFVTGSANSIVWEYDNGRIRLYNTATGEIMSEKIFPDSLQLSTVEVIGNDLFVGGFTFTVNQDSGVQY